jgi:tryptophan-rich sensory protein
MTLFRFATVRPLAGLLLIPYLAWILFATAVNAGIWYLN